MDRFVPEKTPARTTGWSRTSCPARARPPGRRTPRSRERRGLARLWPFLGPAFIAAVAYVDPGNFATNISAGAQFGYLLLWVILTSNLMAMLIQSMSAKLGIATGKNLPEVCRERFPTFVTLGLWVQAEVIAMATDLAEFIGAALALNLLFGIPLFPAGLMTAVGAFGILELQRRGFRPLEAAISSLVGVIVIAFAFQMFYAQPEGDRILAGLFTPQFAGTESVLLAAGILGATVMPHVIYLHSALTQRRVVGRTDEEKRKFSLVDVVIAMAIAGTINASMLIMAAALFNASGLTGVGDIDKAFEQLNVQVGSTSAVLFGVALLASGFSSSSVGTMSGQVVMQGFINRSIPLWLRRFITMLPALVILAVGLNPSRSLVISQVVLSFGIPFAPDPAADPLPQPAGDGGAGQPPRHHGNRHGGSRSHRLPERIPALPDLLRILEPGRGVLIV